MASLAFEMDRAKAQGDIKLSGFSGAVRSLENPGLELNDTWTFPEKYDVYQQKFQGSDNTVDYVWIELENGNAKKFYPTSFTKSRSVWEEGQNGAAPRNTGVRVNTLGTAADLYRSKATIAEAMGALAGKKVKVSKIDTIKTMRFDNSGLQNTQILTIDLV